MLCSQANYATYTVLLLDNEDILRNLSTGAAAAVLGVDRKVLDNILTKEASSLLAKGARGRSRKIDFPTLRLVAIALIIVRDVGVSVARGLQLAEQVGVGQEAGSVSLGSLMSLHFDVGQFERALELAVADAMEEYMPRRRGRPPRA